MKLNLYINLLLSGLVFVMLSGGAYAAQANLEEDLQWPVVSEDDC